MSTGILLGFVVSPTMRAFAGSGSCERPGEISLAHRGESLLDELSYFSAIM